MGSDNLMEVNINLFQLLTIDEVMRKAQRHIIPPNNNDRGDTNQLHVVNAIYINAQVQRYRNTYRL